MNRDKWLWMPHPGHFICSRDCRFFLNTCVGDYIVSTVGELLFDAPVREITAECRNIVLKGKGDARLADYMKKIGYEELGFGRTYETMVFKAMRAMDLCCPYTMTGEELDFEGYKNSKDAMEGHYELCDKWSKK